jgi:NDP-sugar pyrophosphorylase family protein
MQAVILAGGKGTRLRPYTNVIPKPLVPVGEYSILEIILKQLKYYGVTEVVIAVNHLANLIMAFFGNGSSFGLNIRYSVENKVLGTAGPLNLIEGLQDNFLVMNGDLLTTINYRDLFESHLERGSIITIGTYSKRLKIDLGVVKSQGISFIDYIEKPELTYDVSMGLYAMNKEILSFIPPESKFDMPDLVMKIHHAGKSVTCFKGDFEWLDIGMAEDYEAAVQLFENAKNCYLPE